MANINNFSLKVVTIDGNKPARHYVSGENKDAWYVDMPCDNCKYYLEMENPNPDPCDARVEIDGENLGNFRIKRYLAAVLKRPPHTQKQFTFFVGGSEGSKKAGYAKGEKTNGLIKVTFRPGKDPQETSYIVEQSVGECENESVPRSNKRSTGRKIYPGKHGCGKIIYDDDENLPVFLKGLPKPIPKSIPQTKEGITGLSGYSDQKFEAVGPLELYPGRETTIMLRLVHREDDIEPLYREKGTTYPEPVTS